MRVIHAVLTAAILLAVRTHRAIRRSRALFDCSTCGRSFRPTDRSSVFQDVSELVAYHRNAEHADKIVTVLLRHKHRTRELIGLTEGVKHVCSLRRKRDDLGAVSLTDIRCTTTYDKMLTWSVGDAESWIVIFEKELAWVYPRYD